MKHAKTIWLGLAAFSLGFLIGLLYLGTAHAADIHNSTKDSPAYVLPSDVDYPGHPLAAGAYAGLMLGYDIAMHDVKLGAGGFGAELDSIGGQGLTGTAIGGYEFAFGRLRAGPLALYDFGDVDADFSIHTPGGSAKWTTQVSNLWTVGGTFGVTVGESQQTELFGLVGYSQADTDLKGPGLAAIKGLKRSDTLDGMTVGGGVRSAISGGLEFVVLYTYTSFDTEDLFTSKFLSVKDDIDVHAIKAGLVYKFGGGLPKLN